jgi:CheY-like chemotaxis protein
VKPEDNEEAQLRSVALENARSILAQHRGAITRRRVLLADDNRDSADTLAMLLRVEGHEVMIAHDGAAALAAFGGFAPDIVLLDIGMPGPNGYEVARQIRQSRSGAETTLIAITGWGQQSDKERAYAAGFDHHLTKPVDTRQLSALLER